MFMFMFMFMIMFIEMWRFSLDYIEMMHTKYL